MTALRARVLRCAVLRCAALCCAVLRCAALCCAALSQVKKASSNQVERGEAVAKAVAIASEACVKRRDATGAAEVRAPTTSGGGGG